MRFTILLLLQKTIRNQWLQDMYIHNLRSDNIQ